MIRILVADDSPIVLAAVEAYLADEKDFYVVGRATSGSDLLDKVSEHEVDVVVTDLMMPGGTGLSVLSDLKARGIGVIVISGMGAETGMLREAIAQGANDCIAKEDLSEDNGRALRDAIRGCAEGQSTRSNQVLMLLGSAGSPRVIEKLIPSVVEARLPAFFFLHLSDRSSDAIATWISRQGVPTDVAQDRMQLRSGRGIVPAPGIQMEYRSPGRVFLRDRNPVDGHVPSASVLLRSAAWLGNRLTAMVLSGMGHDAQSGVAVAVEAGVNVYAQEASECVVSSMPDAARSASSDVKTLRISEMKKLISAGLHGAQERILPKTS